MPILFRAAVAALVIPALLSAQACSLLVGSTQNLTVTASDPQARIELDGELRGQGSVVVEVARDRSHAVLARVGNRVGTAHVDTTISTTGVLDIVGAVLFLIPVLGVLGPGFWRLETSAVHVRVPAEG